MLGGGRSIDGRWALVTGASSGLGVDLAEVLAERGCNLVLVARREDLLKRAAEGIRQRHPVEARVLSVDLTEPATPCLVLWKIPVFA